MTTALSIIGGLVTGMVIVAIMGLTAPWWIPIIDPFMERWSDWIDRKIKAREERR